MTSLVSVISSTNRSNAGRHGTTRHDCESDAFRWFRSRRWRHVNRDWPDPINRPGHSASSPFTCELSRNSSDDVSCVRMDESMRGRDRVKPFWNMDSRSTNFPSSCETDWKKDSTNEDLSRTNENPVRESVRSKFGNCLNLNNLNVRVSECTIENCRFKGEIYTTTGIKEGRTNGQSRG